MFAFDMCLWAKPIFKYLENSKSVIMDDFPLCALVKLIVTFTVLCIVIRCMVYSVQ